MDHIAKIKAKIIKLLRDTQKIFITLGRKIFLGKVTEINKH